MALTKKCVNSEKNYIEFDQQNSCILPTKQANFYGVSDHLWSCFLDVLSCYALLSIHFELLLNNLKYSVFVAQLDPMWNGVNS